MDIVVRAGDGAVFLAVPLDDDDTATPAIVEIGLDREAAERLAGQISIALAVLSDGGEPEAEPALPDGVIEMAGERYMRDPAGRLVPIELVSAQHLLEDQTVRKILGYAEALSAQIQRFRGHTFDDVGTFVALLAERYGDRRGGRKGNVQLSTFDGLMKVVVSVQDQLAFGPELEVAKGLVDACITAWGEGARAELRALVHHAFQVDQSGRYNREAIFQLRRVAIEDPRWQAAMTAIGDAIRVLGSREYVRFYKRRDARAPWEPVTIDVAKA